MIGGLVLLALVFGAELYLSQGGLSQPARKIITEQSAAILGESVAVEKVRLSLFPPSVTAYNVRLPKMSEAFQGGDVQELRVRVSPWSLVTGGLRVLDIDVVAPRVVFVAPVPDAEDQPDVQVGSLSIPAVDWTAWGSHRLTVTDGEIEVVYGASRVRAEGVELHAAPDVTLRYLVASVSTRQVLVNDNAVLTASRIDIELHPGKVKVFEATVTGEPGQLTVSGELRSGMDSPTISVGLKTEYSGTAAGAVALASHFGVRLPPFSGGIEASGRLYGTADNLNWDGEVEGQRLALPNEPRRLDRASLRLRANREVVELVHFQLVLGTGEVRGSGHLRFEEDPEYDLRIRADDMPVAWLLQEPVSLGTVGGEAHLTGRIWEQPKGVVEWRYRNDSPKDDDPEGAMAPPWRRVAAKLSRAQGIARIESDGAQEHELRLETPAAHVKGIGGISKEGELYGQLDAYADDFAEIGRLIGLPYVHGQAAVTSSVSGTIEDFRLEATGTLEQGRIGDIKVNRLSGAAILTPGQLVYRNVQIVGDGSIRLEGVLRISGKGRPGPRRVDYVAADLRGVPLAPLVALFSAAGSDPLEVDFPVTGKVHVVHSPDTLFVWGEARAGAGTLYGQKIMDGRGRLWIDGEHIALTNASFGFPVGDQRASAKGYGKYWWRSERHEIEMTSEGLPLGSVDYLVEMVPEFSGTFIGKASMVGDFEDADLRFSGRVSDFGYSGMPVGMMHFESAMSGWQLRILGDLKAPSIDAEYETVARIAFYTYLEDDLPFAASVRMLGNDAVPWVRGMMPEADEVNREQLGEDYGLRTWGRMAMTGALANDPEHMLLVLDDLSVVTGGHEARLDGSSRITLKDERLSTERFRLVAEGLNYTVSGGMVPDESYDMNIAASASWQWLDHLWPEYGFKGGEASFEGRLTGGWDTPEISGDYQLSELVVAPPELVQADVAITVSGSGSMVGPLDEPVLGDVQASLSPVYVSVAGYELEAVGKVVVGSRKGVYHLPAVELSGEAGTVQISGDWEYRKNMSLQLVGSVRLSELVRQVDGLGQGAGFARINVEVVGPWESPQVTAGVTVEGGQARIVALDQVLQIDAASILLSEGRLVLDTMEGKLGGGMISAQGAYEMNDRKVRFIASIDRYTAHPVSGLTGVVSGEMMLSGNLPAPTLSGDLHIERALYDRHIQWEEWVMDAVAEKQEEIAQIVPFADTRLAVRVYGDEGLRVDNNLAKLGLDLDLVLGGTIAEPAISGRVDVRSGEIYFREHTFEVIHASLDFVHPDRTEPYLDMIARTTVEQSLPDDPLRTESIEVDMAISGPMEQLDIVLTSRPDMSHVELLSLLTVGFTPEQLEAAGSGVGRTEAIYIGTAKLQGQLAEQVHRFTGIDQFHVDPDYADDASADSTARITVGKKLFEGKGQVIYSVVMDDSQEPLIQFTYRLSSRMSLLMEQDEEGRKGGEVRFRIRFR